eukprot:2920094-Rhodomonas_salina.1
MPAALRLLLLLWVTCATVHATSFAVVLGETPARGVVVMNLKGLPSSLGTIGVMGVQKVAQITVIVPRDGAR